MSSRVIVFVTFIFLCANQFMFAQSSTPGGSVRLVVFGGSNLDFVFNSLTDYRNGITYNNFTRIGISVTDEIGDINAPVGDDYDQWEIRVQADDADADGLLNGTNPANTISFSRVEVQATSVVAGTCGTCNLFGSPWWPLLVVPTVIVDGSAGGVDQIEDLPSAENLNYAVDQINISFRCGFGGTLLGVEADYYSDEIWMELVMSP